MNRMALAKQACLILLVACPISRSAGGQQDFDFQTIARVLNSKKSELRGLMVVASIREQRPRMQRDVSRYSMVWEFPRADVLRPHLLEYDASKDDWSATSPENWTHVSDVENIEENMSAWRSCRLHNSNYSAAIDLKADSGWAIDTIFGSERTWEMPRPDFLPTGMISMYPYDIPIDNFLALGDVSVRSCETNSENPDLVDVICDVDISVEQSPINQGCKGTWFMTFSKSRGLIVKQRLQNDLRKQGSEYEYSFADDEVLPIGFKSTYFDLNGGKKIESILFTIKYVQFAKNRLPPQACYLSFFGLPEPDGVSPPRSNSWTLIVVLVIGFTLLCLILARQWMLQ